MCAAHPRGWPSNTRTERVDEGNAVDVLLSSADNSINDFFITLDKGIPWGSKGLPPSAASLPFVYPTLNNNSNVTFWQRSDSGRPGTNDTWTLDLQKELTPSMSLTVGYSGQKGTHIASALDRFDEIPMSLLDKYGFTLLNSGINTPAARTANIPIPYAGFGSLSAHTVQRALSPFPQFGAINTNGGQPASVGERAGNSTYHAMVMKLDRRFSRGTLGARIVRALQAVVGFRIRGHRRQRRTGSLQ